MTAMKVSTEVVPGRAMLLDLDDWDALLDALRGGSTTFRVIAEDVLLTEPYDLTTLGTPMIRSLDIEAHEPFLRFRFGTTSVPTSRHANRVRRFLELATIVGDERGEVLFDRIERIAVAATKKKPVVDRENLAVRERPGYGPVIAFAVFVVVAVGIAVLCAGLGENPGQAPPRPGPRSNPWAVTLPFGFVAIVLAAAILIERIEAAKAPAIVMARGRAKKAVLKDRLDL